jgi:hypothetical protein
MSTVNNGPQIVRSGLILDLDASYMRSYSSNVHPKPIDIFDWCQNAGFNACSVSRDASMSRQYGSIPLKMVVSGNDPYVSSYSSPTWNLATAANGQTWTVSIYVKASVATTGELFIFGADIDGYYGGVGTYGASGAINITTSWTRVSFTTTMSGANVAFIQVRLDGPNTGGAGITIWWDGLQVERASAATNFNPYYIGDTVWKDVSNNLNNGTLTAGPTYGSSNKGIIVFDYLDDAVTISGNLGAPSIFTLSAWVRSSNISQAQNIFSSNPPFFLRITSSTIRCAVYTGTWIFVNGSVTLSSNVWYNLVLTYDQNFVKGYINGVLDVNSAKTGAPVWGGAIRLGYTTGGEDAPSVTNIAVAQIYNRALTAAEVVQNYEATKTRFGL